MAAGGAPFSNGRVAIAICARCNLKHDYPLLSGDRNVGPGLRVCKDDNDEYDPWRLPARPADAMTLRFPRPDVSIAVNPSALTSEDNNSFVMGENAETYVKPDGAQ